MSESLFINGKKKPSTKEERVLVSILNFSAVVRAVFADFTVMIWAEGCMARARSALSVAAPAALSGVICSLWALIGRAF